MATTLRPSRYIAGQRCHHSRAAFARAARQAEEWQRRHPPRSLDDMLFRGTGARRPEPVPPTGTVQDDSAAKLLAAAMVKQALREEAWEWLEGEEVYLYAGLLGLDEAAWQRQVRRAKG